MSTFLLRNPNVILKSQEVPEVPGSWTAALPAERFLVVDAKHSGREVKLGCNRANQSTSATLARLAELRARPAGSLQASNSGAAHIPIRQLNPSLNSLASVFLSRVSKCRNFYEVVFSASRHQNEWRHLIQRAEGSEAGVCNHLSFWDAVCR